MNMKKPVAPPKALTTEGTHHRLPHLHANGPREPQRSDPHAHPARARAVDSGPLVSTAGAHARGLPRFRSWSSAVIVKLNTPRCVLIEGRSLETMRALIKDRSIDLVCTDPPYGEHTHAKLGTENRGDGRKQREALTFPPLSHDQVRELAREFVRVAKGWILVFTDDRSVAWWGNGFIEAGGAWIRTGHWVKTNPMPLMRGDRPGTGSECIVIGHAIGHHMTWNGGGRPALWRGPRDMDGLHPNQKPVWLMQELLGLFGTAGGTVLDPFLGSGSTAVPLFMRERAPGVAPLESGCKKCQAKHAEMMEGRPPLPHHMSIVGVEGDGPTLQVATDRITPLITSFERNAA